MSCFNKFNEEFLRDNFNKSWLHGDYKEHRQNVLFEREKQQLPQSQYMVANYREAQQLREGLCVKNTRLEELRLQVETLKQEIWRETRQMERLEFNNYKGGDRKKRERAVYTFRCPVGECRGFVSMNEKKCGTCGMNVCCLCGEEEGEVHVCDNGIKANFQEVKRSTKPCPSCHILIHKSEGCSQMFCTQCHCAFDYYTGEKVRGVIHNPHYFNFLREQSETGEIPRQPGDGDCGGLPVPNAWTLSRRIRRDQDKLSEGSTFRVNMMYTFARKLLHIYDRTIPMIERKRNRAQDTSDLHLRYLLNFLDEDEMKIQLQRREKKNNKDCMSLDIYQMCVQVGGQYLWEYVESDQSADEDFIRNVWERIQKLRTYTNEHLQVVCHRYNMTVLEFV
jgi:hypothetical protein